jgi:hypothetical protein
MTAVSLFDMLASVANSGAPTSEASSMAARLIANQLDDLRRVKEYEEPCLAQDWRNAELHARLTREVYALYQQWAVDAREVLDRVSPFAQDKAAVQGLSELEDAYWRVKARLKLTPEMIERAMDQVRRGETIPAEEARNELRNRHRA